MRVAVVRRWPLVALGAAPASARARRACAADRVSSPLSGRPARAGRPQPHPAARDPRPARPPRRSEIAPLHGQLRAALGQRHRQRRLRRARARAAPTRARRLSRTATFAVPPSRVASSRRSRATPPCAPGPAAARCAPTRSASRSPGTPTRTPPARCSARPARRPAAPRRGASTKLAAGSAGGVGRLDQPAVRRRRGVLVVGPVDRPRAERVRPERQPAERHASPRTARRRPRRAGTRRSPRRRSSRARTVADRRAWSGSPGRGDRRVGRRRVDVAERLLARHAPGPQRPGVARDQVAHPQRPGPAPALAVEARQLVVLGPEVARRRAPALRDVLWPASSSKVVPATLSPPLSGPPRVVEQAHGRPVGPDEVHDQVAHRRCGRSRAGSVTLRSLIRPRSGNEHRRADARSRCCRGSSAAPASSSLVWTAPGAPVGHDQRHGLRPRPGDRQRGARVGAAGRRVGQARPRTAVVLAPTPVVVGDVGVGRAALA